MHSTTFREIVVAMPASPETYVGAEVRGMFSPPAGVRAAQTQVTYKLVRFVGAGKFAWVYEALAIDPAAARPVGDSRPGGAADPMHGVGAGGQADTSNANRGRPERVAVKMLYREDTQGVRRFQREIKVMRQLPAHPNCVAYKGHGLFEKHAWVAMDFIDGFTLAAVLRGRRPLPERAACLLMTQLCDGFEGLHRLGLTHRDITPENIMITQVDRQVKLMDFGLVQDSQGLLQLYEQVDIVDGEDFKDDLDAGLIAGTPEFMAPEQILDPHEKDRARQKTDTTADVFALGTIFYQLLSGAQLFPYEVGARGATGKQGLINYLEYRVKHRDEDLVCPEQVPVELWTVLRKSLAHEPKLRQRDATELGADIRYYLETGEGVLEDDMSATISVPFDPARLKSLALQMSTSEFASITRAAAAAGIELPQPTPRPRRDTPPVLLPPEPNTGPALPAPARPAVSPGRGGPDPIAGSDQAPFHAPTAPLSTSTSSPTIRQGGEADPANGIAPTAARPAAGPRRSGPERASDTTIPNELPSPLLVVNPAGPDAPLSPKRAVSGRTPYGGPASEKPTRVEGDAPSPGTLAPPAPHPKRRTWLIALAGAAFVGVGVLVAVLLRS